MLILGIDDAGRGPLIGPMILAGVLLDKAGESALKKYEIKDSKQLPHSKRIKLSKIIKEKSISHYIVKSTPEEIDSSIKKGTNLNTLEAQKAAEIINALNKKDKKITVIIDCPSVNTSAWKKTLMNYIDVQGNLTILCEHKADVNHLSASAASILAKVAREDEVEILKKKYGDFGSLPFDEEVLIDNNGRICLEKIGLLVKEKPRNIKVFSFNTKDYSIKKYKIVNFIEHPQARIYELELEFGKRVRLTKNHPLFCLNENLDIVPKRLDELDIGDHIAVCSNIDNEANLKFLDLLEVLKNDSNKKSPIYVKVSRIFIKINEKKIKNILKKQGYVRTTYNAWTKKKYLPLNIFLELDFNQTNVKICSREDNIKLDRHLKITKELMWFLGIFLAEGWLDNYRTYIANKDKVVINKIKKFGDDYGINYSHNIHKNDICLHSILLVKILKNLIKGNNAYNKEIPLFVFSTNKNMIKAFTNGLYYGDGYLNKSNKWEIELRSNKIISRLQWLNLMVGNFSANRVRKDKPAFITNILSKNPNSLCPYNLPSIAGAYIRRLRENKKISIRRLSKKLSMHREVLSNIENKRVSSIQLNTIGKLLKVLSDKKLTKLINSDLCWLRIKKIKYAGREKVYDLGIPYNNIENFLGGQTGIILHNSGYPSDPLTKKFLKEQGQKLNNSGIFRKSWATWKTLFPDKDQSKLSGF